VGGWSVVGAYLYLLSRHPFVVPIVLRGHAVGYVMYSPLDPRHQEVQCQVCFLEAARHRVYSNDHPTKVVALTIATRAILTMLAAAIIVLPVVVSAAVLVVDMPIPKIYYSVPGVPQHIRWLL
jgi:hypothetical protein